MRVRWLDLGNTFPGSATGQHTDNRHPPAPASREKLDRSAAGGCSHSLSSGYTIFLSVAAAAAAQRAASRHCAVTTPPALHTRERGAGLGLDTRHTRHYVHYTLHAAPDHCPASPRPRPGRALTSCSASAMVPGSSVPAVSGSRTAVAPPSSVATPKMRKGR